MMITATMSDSGDCTGLCHHNLKIRLNGLLLVDVVRAAPSYDDFIVCPSIRSI